MTLSRPSLTTSVFVPETYACRVSALRGASTGQGKDAGVCFNAA